MNHKQFRRHWHNLRAMNKRGQREQYPLKELAELAKPSPERGYGYPKDYMSIMQSPNVQGCRCHECHHYCKPGAIVGRMDTDACWVRVCLKCSVTLGEVKCPACDAIASPMELQLHRGVCCRCHRYTEENTND